MYIHLGGDTVVLTDNIIGIFDIDNTSTSKKTREFLAAMQKQGRIREVSWELPRSFVVCAEGNETAVYICQPSSATLKKRLEHFE